MQSGTNSNYTSQLEHDASSPSVAPRKAAKSFGLNRPQLFFLFFVSGFCGLLYQVVWTRMAFASFGIITPVLSVVISVFMLGLSVGSWLGGKWINTAVRKTQRSAIYFYAFAELIIGLGAFAVPSLFHLGEHVLLAAGQTDSARYLFLSAVVLAFSILPWCVFMGATFPLMMAYIRERQSTESTSFSYLYLANVLGAMSGTLLTALVLVELLGFRHTLWVAAAGNFLITGISIWLGFKSPTPLASTLREPVAPAVQPAKPLQAVPARLTQWILFSTGFVSMAMEVVWIRAFAPVLKTQVYSFAMVVATYLGATFAGSLLYRKQLRTGSQRSTAELVALLCIAAFIPILINDPRFVRANWLYTPHFPSVIVLLASICPFCAILGYLTPGLIDTHSAGSPAETGKAYALNVLGCILGPLFVSYLLLPHIGDRDALVLLGASLLPFSFLFYKSLRKAQQFGFAAAIIGLPACALFFSANYEDHLLKTEKHAQVRRDYAASVLSYGENLYKLLCVNGIGMTTLTPITKFMVHLPLAFHTGKRESALIICFGMGTTFRSSLSWDIDTTAVELVPSVKDSFSFFHTNAAQVLAHPKGRIIIDDGRRFLKRTHDTYDVIVVDPPPPLETAGSSLLYSDEFYALAKRHLNPRGILHMWMPGGEDTAARAIYRSIHESFPYVRAFRPVEDYGMHLLASMEPIDTLSSTDLAARMPPNAIRDLLEWNPTGDIAPYLEQVLSHEIPIQDLLVPDPSIRITDDSPYNEYFFIRQIDLF
jgi:spermidine synthase